MSHIAPFQISMLVGVVILIGLFALLDYYFYRQFFQKKQRPKVLLWAHWALHGTTVGGMLLLFFLFGKQNNPANQQLISSVFILFLAQIWGKLLFLLGSLPRVWIKKERLRTLFLRIGLCGIAVVWLGMSVAVWNAFHPKVRTLEVQIEGLPESFDGYTIAFLSDLHLGLFGTNHRAVDEAVRLTNELRPDLILFGGDLVSLSGEEAVPYIETLGSLRASDGKYGVRGNHDYGIYNRIAPNPEKERALFTEINNKMGITLLDNSAVAIAKGNDTLFLLGTEYFSPGRNFPDGLPKAMEKVPERGTKILLTHNPDHYGASVLGKVPSIALTLSGHTHAMQFVIECFGFRFSPSSFLFERWGGLYENGSQKLYVNEGFGASLYSIRWGTRSEITCIRLRK